MRAILLTSSLFCQYAPGATQPTPPVETKGWLLPSQGDNPMPYWGHDNGIGVTVPACRGPRGLIGIHTPYLGQTDCQSLNFVAVEPVVEGRRGFSEMEHSVLDGVQGLRLWTTNDLDRDSKPDDHARPAQGRLDTVGGVQTLSFHVHIERMHNGAQPIIQVIFRAGTPHEVGFKLYAADQSAKMDSCILSATMGNYARLRLLRLKSGQADAATLWTGESAPDNGFFPHRAWSLGDLITEGGAAVAFAQPSEADPAAASYSPNVPSHWKYKGIAAIQFWRSPRPSPNLVCRVNARQTYYGPSGGTIPGGAAFENFELEEPFAEGQEFQFGAAPVTPNH